MRAPGTVVGTNAKEVSMQKLTAILGPIVALALAVTPALAARNPGQTGS